MSDELAARAAQIKAEYQRQWRAKHPDKTREYNRRYWANKAKKAAEKQEPPRD